MAFMAMLLASIALLVFVLGIGWIILGIVLTIITLVRIKKGIKKNRVLSVISILSFIFGFISLLPLTFMMLSSNVPNSVVIEGVTYRSGFYGDLYPNFGQVGDIGSDTLQEEVIYDDGKNRFRRVDFEGYDWVHSYVGGYTGGTVYCAENQWEQMLEYYADDSNFDYYYGIGYYIAEKAVDISDIDIQKFNELLAFANENHYEPFNAAHNTQRIPKSEYYEGFCFYKISKDGYFSTARKPMFFVYQGRLLMVFYYDGGRSNGGIEEVVAIDVPHELGQYFIGVIEQNPAP